MAPKLPTEQQAVWDPEPVRRSEDEKNRLAAAGIRNLYHPSPTD